MSGTLSERTIAPAAAARALWPCWFWMFLGSEEKGGYIKGGIRHGMDQFPRGGFNQQKGQHRSETVAKSIALIGD